MSPLFRTFLFSSACASIFAMTLNANTARAEGKQKLDTFIQQAIEDTAVANPEPLIDDEPLEEYVEEISAEPVVVEEQIIVIEEPPEEQPVLETASSNRPETGAVFGNFHVQPSLMLMQKYDSNIRATENNEISDFISVVRPAIDVGLINSKHEMNLALSYEHNFYKDENYDDHGDLMALLNGQAQLGESVSVPYSFGYEDRHQERFDNLTTTQPDELLAVETLHADLGFSYKPGSLELLLMGQYKDEEFEDGQVFGTNTAFIRSDSDRETVGGYAKVGFDVAANTQAYVRGGYNERDYKRLAYNGATFSGVNRDSEEYYALAGLSLNYESVSALIEAGYTDRDYDDTAIDNVQDIIGAINVTWMLGENSSFTGLFERSIFEDDDITTPIIQNTFGLAYDQRLSENWQANANARYNMMNFENSTRDDKVWDAGLGLDYIINPFLSVGAGYTYMTRDSDAANLDYDKHIAMLRLNGKI